MKKKNMITTASETEGRGKRFQGLVVIALVTSFLFAGCSGYNGATQALSNAWAVGNTAAAVSAANNVVKSGEGKDAVLFRLEQGTVLQANGSLLESIEAFDAAEEKINEYEAGAKTKVGRETLALITNLSTLPYRGRNYDKVMLNTYKALNYMALGDEDSARVELNRVNQRQENAVVENAKRIEEAQEEAKAAANGTLTRDGKRVESYDVKRAQKSTGVANAEAELMTGLDAQIIGTYNDYVNPFSVFLDGVFFAHKGLDASDFERARKSFQRVSGMSPSPYIEADLAMVEAIIVGQRPDPVTYVIYSTGSAPSRDETRIDIPTFIVSNNLSYVGASFPRLVYAHNYTASARVMAEGKRYDTSLLCSMDSVISKDFKNEWPTILTKTLLASATKALAQYSIEKSVGDSLGNSKDNPNNMAALFALKVGLSLVNAASNQADLRTWKTLPKQFHYARFATPKSGTATIQVGLNELPVAIEPGQVNVILVRSINSTTRPIISQFTL